MISRAARPALKAGAAASARYVDPVGSVALAERCTEIIPHSPCFNCTS